MEKQLGNIKNDDLLTLQKLIKQQQVQIFELKNIINYLPTDVYWKHYKDEKLVYSGMNQVGINSLQQMGFKFEINDIVNKTDHDLFDQETADGFLKNDLNVIHQGVICMKEETANLLSGKKITQLSTKRPLLDEQGDTVGVIGMSINITELKETQLKKAEVANRAKDAFIMNMAHDIRTPLTGMIHMSEDLTEMVTKDEEASLRAQLLFQSSKRLLTLLESVLELSKAEQIGADDIKKEPVDLRDMIQQLSQLLLPSIKEKGLTLKIEVDSNLPQFVETDRIKLERILLNLTGNAIKFTEKGEIKLTVRYLGQQEDLAEVEFRFSDTGIGIPSDQQEKIFDRFVRLDPSYRGVYKGYGVGLFLVKQYVDALGGSIDVKSTLGQGTTFCIRLNLAIADQVNISKEHLFNEANAFDPLVQPFHKNNAAQAKHVSPSEEEGSGAYILLIEDDPSAQLGAKLRLKRVGYRVATADNVANALQCLKEQHFDLILSDIGLPDGDGMEFTRKYRHWEKKNNKPYTPIVALTGHAVETMKENCVTSGMDEVFKKPLGEETLEALNRILAGAQAQDMLAYPLFDEQKARVLSDEAELSELIPIFLSNQEDTLLILKKAYEEKNWKTIAFQTHKLKGSSSYVAALRLQAICAELGRSLEDPKARESLFQQLVEIIDATETALKAWLKK